MTAEVQGQDRLRRLHDASAEMTRSLDIGHRLRIAVAAARDLVPADAAAVLLPDAAGETLVIKEQDGLSSDYAARQRVPLEGVRGLFEAAGDHLILDLEREAIGNRGLIRAEGLAKMLSVPLYRDAELIGAIAIYTKDPARRFTPDDIEVARTLATWTGISIINAELFDQAVEQRELLRHLLDSLGEGVIIAWPDGRYEANPRAQEILGVGPLDSLAVLRETVNVRLASGRRPDGGGYPVDRALRGEANTTEMIVTPVGGGADRELAASAAPVAGPSGEVVAAVMTLHDLTELRQADREREQFLSIVSHELRTPLTPLKALAQLVRSRMRRSKEQGAPLDLDSLDRNLAAIERQVDRMNGLVSDLLSVSRAERGALAMERMRYDLGAVVRDVVQRYVDATEEEGRHTFTVDAPDYLYLHGDQARVEQLLMNLVGNAVKYSPTGGEVRVRLRALDGVAELAISDDGIGIPQDDLERLAHPFIRGAGRAATFAGMGVGLYVARIVAEAHSGSLALESDGEGKGTTVTVKLPL